MTTRWAGLSIVAAVAFCGCRSNMQIIAHRGASYLAPENTVASALLAWDKEADAVEVDIYLSSDGQVVVIHDKTTKRTGGEELEVAKSTAEQLRTLDVGSFKNPVYAGQKIPLLEEVIETVPPGKQLFVEIKCGPEVLPALDEIFTAGGKRGQIVVIGFGYETVVQCKQRMPDIPTYWLVGTKKVEETEEWIPHDPTLTAKTVAGGLDGLNVHWAGVTKEFASAVKAAGLGLYVWTVDDPAEATRLKDLGVQGITTNRPAFLRDQVM